MKTYLTLAGIIATTSMTLGCGSGMQTSATSSGITVTSNQVLSTYQTDMCTQYAGEACYFMGGQRVKFSDGSVLLTGQWNFSYEVVGDTDTNENTVTAFIPANVNSTYQTLSTFVATGAGYQRMFLVYVRSPESISLYQDTNANTTCCTGDTKITTLTLSDITGN